MLTCGLLFQWASTKQIQLSVLVWYKANHIIISLKINMFSPLYSWKIAELALNNNHSLTHLINLHVYPFLSIFYRCCNLHDRCYGMIQKRQCHVYTKSYNWLIVKYRIICSELFSLSLYYFSNWTAWLSLIGQSNTPCHLQSNTSVYDVFA